GSEELDPRRQSTSRTEGGSDSFDLRNLSTDQATRARISVRRTTGLGQSPITAPIRPNTHGLGWPALIVKESARPMKRPYTDKQGQYLAFIYYYGKIHGSPPSESEMQQYFQVSPHSVHQM